MSALTVRRRLVVFGVAIAMATIGSVGVAAGEIADAAGNAALSGAREVPPVATDATGVAKFRLAGDVLYFRLLVDDIDEVTQAHIHVGAPDVNGGAAAFLFGFADPPTGEVSGLLAQGAITEADLIGEFAGDFDGFVDAMLSGGLYVNVHTVAYPAGEIRGQILPSP